MIRSANTILTALVAATFLGMVGSTARADIILEQYEFQGQPGSQTSQTPSFVATGLSGSSFQESANLTPSAGANSMNSSGWTNAGANYSFGFTINPGQSVTVDQIILASRSSATGPGFISLQASADGGAFTTVASITQT